MNVFICNSDLNQAEIFSEFAAAFGTTVHNDQFDVPAEVGRGRLTERVISSELSVTDITYELSLPIYTGVLSCQTETYYLNFSINSMPVGATLHVQLGEIAVPTQVLSWKHAFLMSSHFDMMAMQPAGFNTDQLLLAFTRGWLNEVIGLEAASRFFDQYLLLRARMFSAFELTEDLQEKSATIKKSIREGREAPYIEALCKEIAGIYFREMTTIIHALTAGSFNEQDTMLLLKHVLNAGESFFLKPATRVVLATELGMSASKLGDMFKEIYKMPYSDYLHQRRMEWAAAKLAGGGVKVADIADALGYENYSRFTEAFQKHSGLLPSQVLKEKSGIADGI